MTAFELFFLIGLSLYLIQLFVFTIGASAKYKKIKEEQYPSASLIVAARNEELNIIECLTSLDKLEYPENKLEIIIVNDHSTDSTGALIDEFIKGKARFKCFIPDAPVGNLKGKTNALAYAIKKSVGEIILTTDADCRVNPNWVKTIASYYKDNVAFVGGYTYQKAETVFGGMQGIDFLYLLTVGAGVMNIGKPSGCIGNNMSFTRKAYDEIGGYENLPFSITEDFNLLKAIHDLKKYKVITPIEEDILVISEPCPTWKTLYWQKKRWGVGGMKNDWFGYFTMLGGYLSHIAIVLLPFFFTSLSLYLAVSKFMIDYFFISPVFSRLKLKLKLSHFLAFEIYFIIYVLILPFIVLPNRKVMWKGREF